MFICFYLCGTVHELLYALWMSTWCFISSQHKNLLKHSVSERRGQGHVKRIQQDGREMGLSFGNAKRRIYPLSVTSWSRKSPPVFMEMLSSRRNNNPLRWKRKAKEKQKNDQERQNLGPQHKFCLEPSMRSFPSTLTSAKLMKFRWASQV